MVLLVSYDLNRYERPAAYEAVKNMIVLHAISYMKPLYSQWLVETNDSAAVWSDRMKQVADKDDSWFVCRVYALPNYAGWLPQDVWDWLVPRAK